MMRQRCTMNDEDLQRLDLKMAYLERANQDLSDVIYRQQREIRLLEARLTALVEQFELLKAQPAEYSEAEERPPHY
jgi:SlyX protein